jgi:tetratricopeptide (TPR) repeat protein
MHANLGNALVEAGDLHEAEIAFGGALQLRPWYPTAIGGLCMVYEETSRLAEAESLARQASAAVPDEPLFRYRHGRALFLLRRPLEAASELRAAIALKPDYGVAWCFLAETVRRDNEDAEFKSVQALTASVAVAAEERAFAGFALGRSLADLGRHDESVAAFKAANAISRQNTPGAAEAEVAGLRHRLLQFQEFPASAAGAGFADADPVFVVGLPRSGKTTIESILTRSDPFSGVGEQRIMPRLVATALARHGEDLSGWPAAAWTALGEAYASEVAALVPSGRRPVDTLPPNFALVGFIHAALPHATIIHTRRDRPDHLVALFEKYLTGGGYAYTTDIACLLAYHRAYTDLMANWHRLLPATIHDVDIADAASMSRLFARFALPAGQVTAPTETEPRTGDWPRSRIETNSREHLDAWRAAHPELFDASNAVVW